MFILQIEILTNLKRDFKVDLLKVKLLTQYNAQRHLLEEKLKTAIAQNRDVFDHYDKFKVNVSTVVSSQGMEGCEISHCLQSSDRGL